MKLCMFFVFFYFIRFELPRTFHDQKKRPNKKHLSRITRNKNNSFLVVIPFVTLFAELKFIKN